MADRVNLTVGARREYIAAALATVMAGSLALLIYGQYVLHSDFPRYSTQGSQLMAVGGAVFLLAFVLGRGRRAEALTLAEDDAAASYQAAPFRWPAHQTTALAVALTGGLYGFVQSDHNTFSLLGAGLWLIGCGALVVGFWRPQGSPPWRLHVARLDVTQLSILLFLALIVALATFLRFYQLYDVPRNMTGDHVVDLLDIRGMVEDGARPVYLTANQGREPLKFYLIAPFAAVFGYSFFILKVTTAIAGVLAALTTYFMARELFDNRKAALIAATLFSVSYVNVLVSRGGFRDALAPLAFALVLLFLFRALKHHRTHDFVFSGLALGVALYTYSPLRALPVAVALVLVIAFLVRLLSDRKAALVVLANGTLLVLATLVVFAPLGRFVIDDPDMYFARTTGLTDLPWQTSDPISTLATNVRDTLLVFNWTSDVWPSQQLPILDYATGSLFPLGVAVLLIAWSVRRKSLYGYASLILLASLIPDYLKREGDTASGLRVAFLIPLAVTFAAAPLYVAADRIREAFGRGWPLVAGPALAATLAFLAFVNHQMYFDDWVSAHGRVVENTSEVAAAVEDFTEGGGKLENAFVKTFPYWMGRDSLRIEVHDFDWEGVLEGDIDMEQLARQHAVNPEPKLYVFHHNDVETLLALRQVYPEGILENVHSRFDSPGKDFRTFQVAGRAAAP